MMNHLADLAETKEKKPVFSITTELGFEAPRHFEGGDSKRKKKLEEKKRLANFMRVVIYVDDSCAILGQ